MSLAGKDSSPLVVPHGGYLPAMVSYAQNREDVMLRRALQDIEIGFYIDIGACDPVDLSVTNAFYLAGWRGINVEPNPEFTERLRQSRTRDINLGCAVSDLDGQTTFHVFEGTGLSHLSDRDAAAVTENPAPRRTITVETRRLSSIWDEFASGICVDFLKIDAEGSEYAIISSTDFRTYRPRIVVVEATEPFSQRPAWSQIEPILLEADYVFAYFDGLNRFYVRAEDSHRLSYFELPPCLFDNYTPSLVIDLQRRIDELSTAHHHQNALIEAQAGEIRHARAETVRMVRDACVRLADDVEAALVPPSDQETGGPSSPGAEDVGEGLPT